MATGRWLRIDVGFDESDWLIDLTPGARLAWIKLLVHVKRDGVGGRCRCLSARAAAVVWRIAVEEVETMLAAAQVLDPKDGEPAVRVADGHWEVVHWPDYQVVDETAAERMRRYRADKSRLSPLRRNNRNAPSRTVTDRNRCHATETETETETETLPPSPAPARRRKKEMPLPEGWHPKEGHGSQAELLGVDLIWEAERFRNHAESHDRRAANWDAAFRNWLKLAKGKVSTNGPRPEQEKPKKYKVMPWANDPDDTWQPGQ